MATQPKTSTVTSGPDSLKGATAASGGRGTRSSSAGSARSARALADRVAVRVDDADVPGLHRQRLALGPEPDEVDAEDTTNRKPCNRWRRSSIASRIWPSVLKSQPETIPPRTAACPRRASRPCGARVPEPGPVPRRRSARRRGSERSRRNPTRNLGRAGNHRDLRSGGGRGLLERAPRRRCEDGVEDTEVDGPVDEEVRRRHLGFGRHRLGRRWRGPRPRAASGRQRPRGGAGRRGRRVPADDGRSGHDGRRRGAPSAARAGCGACAARRRDRGHGHRASGTTPAAPGWRRRLGSAGARSASLRFSSSAQRPVLLPLGLLRSSAGTRLTSAKFRRAWTRCWLLSGPIRSSRLRSVIWSSAGSEA